MSEVVADSIKPISSALQRADHLLHLCSTTRGVHESLNHVLLLRQLERSNSGVIAEAISNYVSAADGMVEVVRESYSKASEAAQDAARAVVFEATGQSMPGPITLDGKWGNSQVTFNVVEVKSMWGADDKWSAHVRVQDGGFTSTQILYFENGRATWADDDI